MKKLVSLLLVIVMMASLTMSFATAEDKVSLEVWCSGSGVPNDDTNVILPALEEATGIDLTWNTFASDYDTSLNVRLGSGDIPDIFMIPYNMVGTCLKQDLLFDISTIYDQLTDVQAVYSDIDYSHMFYDGQMCLIPNRMSMPKLSLNIRKDWLDNLNLSVPTTLDELYDVLYAFTYNDPDGDGQQNTYGLTGSGLSGFMPIFVAFGVVVPTEFFIRDGQLVYSGTDNNMKDAIAYIKKMIEAGIVDPEMMTNGSTEHRDKAIRGEAGMVWVDVWNMQKQVYQDQIHEINPNAEWILLDYIEGPGGAHSINYGVASAPRYYALSADLEGEKLAAAIKLINYLANPTTGGRLVAFGIQDVHYTLSENGEVVALKEMDNLGYSWVYQITGRDDFTYMCTKFPYAKTFIDQCAANDPYVIKTYNGAVSAPEGVSVSDIDTYVNGEITRFIYGERSIDEWDQYIETLNSFYHFDQYYQKAVSDITEKGYMK